MIGPNRKTIETVSKDKDGPNIYCGVNINIKLRENVRQMAVLTH